MLTDGNRHACVADRMLARTLTMNLKACLGSATVLVAFLMLGSRVSAAQGINKIFNNRVELAGSAADSLVQATAQLVKDGASLSSLRSYTVKYSSGGGGAGCVVTFTAPSGQESKFDVSGNVVTQRRAVVPGNLGWTITGAYVAALYQGYAIWHTMPIGSHWSLSSVGVTIIHPFNNDPAIYWIYFSPPEMKHAGPTVGCGLSRGFSVNVDTFQANPLKPVC